MDGEPLCPVIGPAGYRPADPSTAPTRGPAGHDPGPDEKAVFIVAGGDMVAVFTDAASAAVQQHVMIAAGLEPLVRQLISAEWDRVHADLMARSPDITIADVRTGRPCRGTS